jgi:hypothetical protein
MPFNKFMRTGALLLFVCAVIYVPCTVLAAPAQPEEYEIKAAFIFNMLQFVEWPAEELSSRGTMAVCIYGKNPFGASLDSIEGKKVWGKTLLLRKIYQLQQIRHCQIVFISSSEHNAMPAVLNITRGIPILTIGDTEGFSEQGVIINFFIAENNKVRFEINKEASMRAGLKISSHLLKLSRITREGQP